MVVKAFASVFFILGAALLLSSVQPLLSLRDVSDDKLLSAALSAMLVGSVRILLGWFLIQLSKYIASKSRGAA